LVTFVFGIAFVQGAAGILEDMTSVNQESRLSQEELEEVEQELREHWKSISRAMYTLYKAGTGGDDWGAFAIVWEKGYDLYFMLFLFYISFFMFVLSNMVTSLFVDNILAASQSDDVALVQEHVQARQTYMNEIRDVWGEMEKDKEGKVSTEEFKKHVNTESLQAFAWRLEVEPEDLVRFFLTLSCNGKKAVDLETFVLGCIKLRSTKTNLDILEMQMQTHEILAYNKAARIFSADQFAGLKSQVADVAGDIGKHGEKVIGLDSRFREFHQTLKSHQESLKAHQAAGYSTNLEI